jgi:PAS domain S-box-containing protein
MGRATSLSSARSAMDAVLDTVPTPISLWDTDVRNVYANRAAYRRWFGRDSDELRGVHSSDLLGPELYELNKPHQRKCLDGEPQLFERLITAPDGQVRHAQVEYHPYWQDGEVVGLITVITDITSRVTAEELSAASVAQLASLAERRRIEERAHDGTLQALFAAQLRLDCLRVKAGEAAADILAVATATADLIDQAIADLRTSTSTSRSTWNDQRYR